MGFSFFSKPSATVEIADPGNGNEIASVADSAIVAVESGGAESRTLAAPVRIAQRLVIYDEVHGGLVNITAPTALDASLNTVIQLTAARAIVEVISILHAGTIKWQVGWKSPEITLSSP